MHPPFTHDTRTFGCGAASRRRRPRMLCPCRRSPSHPASLPAPVHAGLSPSVCSQQRAHSRHLHTTADACLACPIHLRAPEYCRVHVHHHSNSSPRPPRTQHTRPSMKRHGRPTHPPSFAWAASPPTPPHPPQHRHSSGLDDPRKQLLVVATCGRWSSLDAR